MDYQEKIAKFYKKNHRMPNYAEMMDLFGFKSKNAVTKLVDRLVTKGAVGKDGKGFLIPKKLFGEVKVLGTIEAGFPSPAEEELVDTMTLDTWLIKHKEATYMLKVQGDSMIDAGIMPGDMVLVDRSRTPKSGDIVIAEIDDGWTMKFLRGEGAKAYLMPANKKYKPIYPKNELVIAAVVISVIRKLHD